MPPPIEHFPPTELTERVQINERGKLRKAPVDLTSCPMKEMVQYFCYVKGGDNRDVQANVICEPVVRLFRK